MTGKFWERFWCGAWLACWLALLACVWRGCKAPGGMTTADPPPGAAGEAPAGFQRTGADDESDQRASEPSPDMWKLNPEAAQRVMDRLREERPEGRWIPNPDAKPRIPEGIYHRPKDGEPLEGASRR
jgi:hypothetical protein